MKSLHHENKVKNHTINKTQTYKLPKIHDGETLKQKDRTSSLYASEYSSTSGLLSQGYGTARILQDNVFKPFVEENVLNLVTPLPNLNDKGNNRANKESKILYNFLPIIPSNSINTQLTRHSGPMPTRNPKKQSLVTFSDTNDLIQQLKKKWEEVNQEYQLHTHKVIFNTIVARERKEAIEQILLDLERSILLLSHSSIMIDTTA